MVRQVVLHDGTCDSTLTVRRVDLGEIAWRQATNNLLTLSLTVEYVPLADPDEGVAPLLSFCCRNSDARHCRDDMILLNCPANRPFK